MKNGMKGASEADGLSTAIDFCSIMLVISISHSTPPPESTTSTLKEIEEATLLLFHQSVEPRTFTLSGIQLFTLKLMTSTSHSPPPTGTPSHLMHKLLSPSTQLMPPLPPTLTSTNGLWTHSKSPLNSFTKVSPQIKLSLTSTSRRDKSSPRSKL